MSSKRQARFESLFQEEMAAVLTTKGREWFGTSFISVSEVRFSPDLHNANIFLSLHGIEDEKSLFKRILEQKGALKRELGKKVRHRVRKMPDIEFHLDDSIDRAGRIDELLKD